MDLSIASRLCFISLDERSGALVSIRNLAIPDTVVRPEDARGSPFLFTLDGAVNGIGPGEMRLDSAEAGRRGRMLGIRARWSGSAITCELSITMRMNEAGSLWSLGIRNTGARTRTLAVEFPRLAGVMPDPIGGPRRGDVLDQNGRRLRDVEMDSPGSAAIQWYCVVDPARSSALGMVVRDPLEKAKRLSASERSFSVSLEPCVIPAGGAVILPPVRVLAYVGGWHETAFEYQVWRRRAFRDPEPPRWLREGPRGPTRITPRAQSICGAPSFHARALSTEAGSARREADALFTESLSEAMASRCNGALLSRLVAGRPEALLPFRQSFPWYRPCLVGQAAAPASSVSGVPWLWDEASEISSRNWACALASAWEALVWGELCPDPPVDDPAVVARRFRGRLLDLVIAARFDDQALADGEFPRLAAYHAPYEVSIPAETLEAEAAACDLEELAWTRCAAFVRAGAFAFGTSANWAMCLVLKRGVRVVGFDRLPPVGRGGKLGLRPVTIAGGGKERTVRLTVYGLHGDGPRQVTVPIAEEHVIRIPEAAAAGLYPVVIEGKRIPAFMRLLPVV